MDLYLPKLIHSSSSTHHSSGHDITNNNNNNNMTKLGSSKKKWTMSSLSSLNEVTDYDDNNASNFNSTENIRRAVSPPPLLGRESDVIKEEKVRARRKSWHVGKFEKKRRKGIPLFGHGLHFGSKETSESTSPTGIYEKHKRFSLWNVFPLDHWPRYVHFPLITAGGGDTGSGRGLCYVR